MLLSKTRFFAARRISVFSHISSIRVGMSASIAASISSKIDEWSNSTGLMGPLWTTSFIPFSIVKLAVAKCAVTDSAICPGTEAPNVTKSLVRAALYWLFGMSIRLINLVATRTIGCLPTTLAKVSRFSFRLQQVLPLLIGSKSNRCEREGGQYHRIDRVACRHFIATGFESVRRLAIRL
jgi:hypothetical protein